MHAECGGSSSARLTDVKLVNFDFSATAQVAGNISSKNNIIKDKQELRKYISSVWRRILNWLFWVLADELNNSHAQGCYKANGVSNYQEGL